MHPAPQKLLRRFERFKMQRVAAKPWKLMISGPILIEIVINSSPLQSPLKGL